MMSATDVSLQIGEQTLTGKGAIVRDFTIRMPAVEEGMGIPLAPSPVEIKITMLIPSERFSTKSFKDGYAPKIRNKKVENCTVQELFFAIREKVRGKT